MIDYVGPDGKRVRRSVGSDERLAQKAVIKFNQWLLDGKDPLEELEREASHVEMQSMTLNEFFHVFMRRHGSLQSENMKKLYTDRMKQIRRCPEICDIPMSNITRKLVLLYHDARLHEGVSIATANREVQVIRTMLSRAVAWEILPDHKLSTIQLPSEGGKRNVDVTPRDISNLVDHLPRTIGLIVLFAVYTGFRKQNILKLRIEDIDFERCMARIIPKGKRKYVLHPISGHAVDVVRDAIGDRTGGYVFLNQHGDRYSDINWSFVRAVKTLGLTAMDGSSLRFHDLRHVFATWLHSSGATLDDIMILLGHSQRSTTERYTTCNTNNARERLNLLPDLRKGK